MTTISVVLTGISIALLLCVHRYLRERRCVEWHPWMTREGTLRVINEGLDRAMDVTIQVWDDNKMVSSWRPVVSPGDHLDFEIDDEHTPDLPPHPAAGHCLTRAFRRRRSARTVPFVGPSVRAHHAPRPAHAQSGAQRVGGPVEVRIAWRSPRGRWDCLRVTVPERTTS